MYAETKLGCNPPFKDKIKFNHRQRHDFVYYVKFPEGHEDYIREIGR